MEAVDEGVKVHFAADEPLRGVFVVGLDLDAG
jgi:hypothetical protein